MSVAALHGYSRDLHSIPDQRTQRPQPWPKVVSDETARDLASDLRARLEGEVRFDDMAPRFIRLTPPTTGRCRSGW
ncbi:MAG: hypothetical protein WBX25_36920 [Rhodomicrobium sp.]